METQWFRSDLFVNSRLWTPEEMIRSLWGSLLHDTHTHTHREREFFSLSLSLSLSGNEPNPPLKLKVDEVDACQWEALR